jgi:hypothetical protein
MRPPDCRCPPSHAAFPDASVCPVHGSGTAPLAAPPALPATEDQGAAAQGSITELRQYVEQLVEQVQAGQQDYSNAVSLLRKAWRWFKEESEDGTPDSDAWKMRDLIADYLVGKGEPPAGPPALAAALAQRFHETYERLAPYFGYRTRKESAVPWEKVPEANRRLMIAVCAELLYAAPALAVPLLREAKDLGAAAQGSITEPDWRDLLFRLFRWAEMEIEGAQAVGFWKPHGFIRDHGCRECFPLGDGMIPQYFVCGYHAAKSALEQQPAGPSQAVSSPSAPPAASSASTSATLREIDKILGDYCGFTHLGCGPRDVYLERERRALEVLRSAESARDARTRNDVLRDLRDWLESWGDGRSIANVVLAGVATEAPAPPLDEKEGKGQ